MKSRERQQIKKWISIWKDAGKMLEETRGKELVNFDYWKNWRVVDSLLDAAMKTPAPPRRKSGLVSMQDLFRKWRRASKSPT